MCLLRLWTEKRTKMGIEFGKYVYSCEDDPPCAILKEDMNGILQRVDFCPKHDHLRGTEIDLSLEAAVRHFHIHGLTKHSRAIKETTLEMCGDFVLEMLSEEEIGESVSPPLEELKQVRELERLARRTMGDYREHKNT